MTSASEHVHRLYRHHHGWGISAAEEHRVAAARSSATYGEIRPAALAQLLQRLEPRPADVLYDFGSGIGKVVLQAAMSVRMRRIVGVELVQSRHAIAERVLARARTRGLLSTRRVELRCANFMRVDASDATIVYTCSTAFSDAFMRSIARRLQRLRPGLVLVSTQELDPPGRFTLIDELVLDMSWRKKARVHLYRLREAAVNRRDVPARAAR